MDDAEVCVCAREAEAVEDNIDQSWIRKDEETQMEQVWELFVQNILCISIRKWLISSLYLTCQNNWFLFHKCLLQLPVQ